MTYLYSYVSGIKNISVLFNLKYLHLITLTLLICNVITVLNLLAGL